MTRTSTLKVLSLQYFGNPYTYVGTSSKSLYKMEKLEWPTLSPPLPALISCFARAWQAQQVKGTINAIFGRLRTGLLGPLLLHGLYMANMMSYMYVQYRVHSFATSHRRAAHLTLRTVQPSQLYLVSPPPLGRSILNLTPSIPSMTLAAISAAAAGTQP